jgi:ADP-heptose:LPS heptosyltransferase
LRLRYPKASLYFVTKKSNNKLLALIQDLDETFFIDDSHVIRLALSSIMLFFRLYTLKIDLFFDLEIFSAYGALVSLFSFSRNRFGFFCSKATDFKAGIYTHLMYFNFAMPVRLCYMQLACMAGAAPAENPELIPYSIPESVRKSAQARLERLVPEPGAGIIAVNVNASELSLARRWPLDRFRKVIRHFARLGYVLLLVGSPEERGYAEKTLDGIHEPELRSKAHNVAGAFPFEEVPVLLELSAAVLTNDTGIMNFAYAQGAKVVALYGPNTPTQYHMESERSVALYAPIYCSPCLYHLSVAPCGDSADCLKHITVDEVVMALEFLLGRRTMRPEGFLRRTPGSGRPVHSLEGQPLGVLREREWP